MKLIGGWKNDRTTSKEPINRPSGTAMRAAIRKPAMIRKELQATSDKKFLLRIMSTQAVPTRRGLGAKRGLLIAIDARLQTTRMTTKLPLPSGTTLGRGMACLGSREVRSTPRRRRCTRAGAAGAAWVAGTRSLTSPYKLLMKLGSTASLGFTAVSILPWAFQKSAAAFTLS